MFKKWPKISQVILKIQRLKFDNSIDKENSIWKRKVKNKRLRTQLEFMKVLIARKINS